MRRLNPRWLVIGAAVVDDVLGLVILAIVSGLAAGAGLTALGVATTFAVAVGFLVAAVIIGNLIAPRLFGLIDQLRVRGILLVSAFSFALLFGALAGLAGSALIIGSFAAGIVLSSTNQFDLIEEKIKPVADIFTPIFFVSVGAAVNVALFLPWTDEFNWNVLQVGGILLVIAIVGKLISGYTVGWGKQKLNHNDVVRCGSLWLRYVEDGPMAVAAPRVHPVVMFSTERTSVQSPRDVRRARDAAVRRLHALVVERKSSGAPRADGHRTPPAHANREGRRSRCHQCRHRLPAGWRDGRRDESDDRNRGSGDALIARHPRRRRRSDDRGRSVSPAIVGENAQTADGGDRGQNRRAD